MVNKLSLFPEMHYSRHTFFFGASIFENPEQSYAFYCGLLLSCSINEL